MGLWCLSGLGRFTVYSGFGLDKFHCTIITITGMSLLPILFGLKTEGNLVAHLTQSIMWAFAIIWCPASVLCQTNFISSESMGQFEPKLG